LIYHGSTMSTIDFLRQYRVFGFAIFDLAVSFLGFALLASPLSSFFARFGIMIPRKNWLFLTLPIGILVHLIFWKITPMTREFLDLNRFYALKIVITTLLVLGLSGIKIAKR